MKAPLSWLREYVPIEMGVEELASRLALTGTEVERVTEVGVPGDAENLERFVVGKVLECGRHPDADKLSVCIGGRGGGRAADHRLRCSQRRGRSDGGGGAAGRGDAGWHASSRRPSCGACRRPGMILSEAELGLAAKSPGIMVLPDEWEAGELLADHFAISDWVLEVEVTPNRPDCLSVRGLAREIAAITGRSFAEDIAFPHPLGRAPGRRRTSPSRSSTPICARDTPGGSSAASRSRSRLFGSRPASATRACAPSATSSTSPTTCCGRWVNRCMPSTCAPYAGGASSCGGRTRAKTLTTLDNERRVLTEDMLVIADAERASVVAGVMGGLDSEITDSTTDILLEGANFSRDRPSCAPRERWVCAREASTRYEKGLDPEMIAAGPRHGLQPVRRAVRRRGVGGHHRRADRPPLAEQPQAAHGPGRARPGRDGPGRGDRGHPRPAGLQRGRVRGGDLW